MSGCCSMSQGEACVVPSRSPGECPACRQKGKAIPTLTVKSLVREHWRVPVSTRFSFCRTPECDVVYFSDEATFYKPDLKVRVGIKETEDAVPLCYCFGYTREDIRRDIETSGSTEILERIKAEIQNGFCACEVRNPSGACCLGDITRAIQDAKKHAVPAVPRSD